MTAPTAAPAAKPHDAPSAPPSEPAADAEDDAEGRIQETGPEAALRVGEDPEADERAAADPLEHERQAERDEHGLRGRPAVAEQRLADLRGQGLEEDDPGGDDDGQADAQAADGQPEPARRAPADPDALGHRDQVGRLEHDVHRAEQQLRRPDRAGLDEARRHADDVDRRLRRTEADEDLGRVAPDEVAVLAEPRPGLPAAAAGRRSATHRRGRRRPRTRPS